MKVLIVEDEPNAREATRRFLEFRGHRVKAVGSAEEARICAAAWRPEVVVCDWELGGEEDGVDVARSLQEDLGAAVIFMTGHPLDKLRKKTGDLRVSRYLRKPLSLEALGEAVKSAVH